MKELDHKVEELGETIQNNVDLVLAKAPAAGRKGPAADEVAELRARIHADQRLLVQFAEEKVQLALSGYDCLDNHINQCDADIQALQEELQAMGAGDLAMDPYMMGAGGGGNGGGIMYGDAFAPAAINNNNNNSNNHNRRGGSRLRETGSFDSLELQPSTDFQQQQQKSRKTTVTLNLGRVSSGIGGYNQQLADAASMPPPPPTSMYAPPIADSMHMGSRRGSEPTPPAMAAEGMSYQPRRRAAQAAVQQIAAMEYDDHIGIEDSPSAGGGGGGGGGPAGPSHLANQHQQNHHHQQHQYHHHQQQQPSQNQGGLRPEEVNQRYNNPPLVPGLQHSAKKPQAPGRILVVTDINQGLVGRKAEMYWPDDRLWYLVEIRHVDPKTRHAQILYTTGEAEHLDLVQIANDAHMSLIHM
jgi:hypothetical protein